MAEVMEPLAAGLGAAVNLRVSVSEPVRTEDDMPGKELGSPVSGWLPPAEGGSGASAV